MKWALAIPAFDEGAECLETLASLTEVRGAERAVVIVVVNAPEDAAPEALARNAALLEALWSHLQAPPGPTAWGSSWGTTLCVLDRSSSGRRLPEGQGVGLARKLAMDLALRWYVNGTLRSPWVACTDADVALPEGYFQALPDGDARASAALYPFSHRPEGSSAQRDAMATYESYLRYHVLGLRSASSPYAYHAIGSTIACHLEYYARVRGFPRRQAGEDFYLLNKLRKLAPIRHLSCEPISVRGRYSTRVPFGTGRAIESIASDAEAFTVYHPDIYWALGQWNAALKAFAETPDPATFRRMLHGSDALSVDLLDALEDLGALEAAHDAASRVRPGAPLMRRLIEWNDAFRTLKLIHRLRESSRPSISLRAALSRAPFIPEAVAKSPLRDLPHALSALEQSA